MKRIKRLMAGVAALLPFPVGATPTADDERLERIESMYATYRLGFADVPSVTASELKRMIASDTPPVIVDVRPEDERRVATLPGALSAEAFDPDSVAQGQVVVSYCTIGARSGTWAAGMREKGLDVRNLAGSILAWTHVGGPLVDAEGNPTHQVHVYGRKWNLAADGYEGVVTKADGEVAPP